MRGTKGTAASSRTNGGEAAVLVRLRVPLQPLYARQLLPPSPTAALAHLLRCGERLEVEVLGAVAVRRVHAGGKERDLLPASLGHTPQLVFVIRRP